MSQFNYKNIRLTWSMCPNLTKKTPEIGQLNLFCCLYFQLSEEIFIIDVVLSTAKNTVISPDFLVWKLGEITVFFAV